MTLAFWVLAVVFVLFVIAAGYWLGSLVGVVNALYQLETEVRKVMRSTESMDGPTAWATLSELDKRLAGFDIDKLRSVLKSHAHKLMSQKR